MTKEEILKLVPPEKIPVPKIPRLKFRCPWCNKMIINCKCYEVYNLARREMIKALTDKTMAGPDKIKKII